MAAMPWFLCVLLVPMTMTVGLLRLHGPSRKSPGLWIYLSSLAVDHAWLTCECLVLCACAELVAPKIAIWICAAFVSAMICWMTLDAALCGRAGIRLRWGIFVFTSALIRMGYRDQLGVATALLVLGAITEVTVQGTLMHATWPGLEQLDLIGWIWATWVLGCASVALRLAMPMPLTYHWNLWFASWQHALVRAPFRWAVIWARGDLRDADGVPLTLVARHEESTRLDKRYPLLREQHAFTGARHFDFRCGENERPHVVCLFLESFRSADVGACGAPHAQSITPCFDALSRQGVLWRNCHASATVTSQSMLATLYGVPPAMDDESLQRSHAVVPMVGLPQIFAARDYLTACFTDGPMEFENTRTFFLNHGFAAFYGTPSVVTAYPDAPDRLWNFDDAYLMRFHAAWLARQQARGIPTFSTLLTITNHVPWKAPEGAPLIQTDAPPDSDYGRFLRTMHYSDACLGMYVDLLHKTGLAENTILLVMGDHGQEVMADNAIRWTGRCPAESTGVPLLLLAPGRVNHTVVDEVASLLDTVPTVLDLLGINTTHHSAGSSLVRVDPLRQARTFHPFAPAAMAVQDATHRFVYNVEADKTALDPPRPDDWRLRWRRWQEVQVMRHFLHRVFTQRLLAPLKLDPVSRRRWEAMPASEVPADLEESGRMLDALRKGSGQGRVHRNRIAVLSLVVHANNLADPLRMELLRLLLTRVHVAELGELSDAEEARLQSLVASVRVPPDLGPFEQSMVEMARQLARIKPLLHLRVLR